MSDQYDAVLLDMDGVLVERSPGWVFAEATADDFDAFDVDPDEDDDLAASPTHELDSLADLPHVVRNGR